jgi:tetratricopeptide (TPR) repeat protein
MWGSLRLPRAAARDVSMPLPAPGLHRVALLLMAPLLSGTILGCAVRPEAPPAAAAEPSTAQATPAPTAAPVSPTAPAAAPAGSASNATDRPADSIPEVPITGALMYQLMAAELAAQQGELGAAYALYLKLARETSDPRLARRAAELALQGRALNQSIEAAELWRKLAPKSPEANQALALLYASAGRFDDSYAILVGDVQSAASPAAELSRIQRQLARAPDRVGALNLVGRLSQPYLGSADVRLVRAEAAQAAGQATRAAEEARAAVALDPDSGRVALAAAQLIQATDRPGALALLQRQADRPEADAALRLAYARLLVADRQYPQARVQFERLLKADPDNAELVYSLALLSLQGNLRSDARTYLQRYLALVEQRPGDDREVDQAYLYLAQIAEEDRQYADALKWLRRIEGGDEYIPARVREASVLTKMKRVEEARKVLQSTPANSAEERLQLLLAEAQLLRETRRAEDAYKLLSQALAKSPDNIALLYDTAMTAEKLDRIDAMEQQLRRVMELKPDHAHAYNALGYTFADRNMRLPEALKLIEKAHQLAPDDPYILDSLGWVYFRMGDLASARKYLELAYSAKPDAEVAIHLAEVLWASGEQARARALLREVRTKEPGNELLQSTIARLRIGL